MDQKNSRMSMPVQSFTYNKDKAVTVSLRGPPANIEANSRQTIAISQRPGGGAGNQPAKEFKKKDGFFHKENF